MPLVTLSVIGNLISLKRELGRGACGVAFLAEAKPGATINGVALPFKVVVKIAKREYLRNDKQHRLAQHEAEVPLVLSHPYVVKYFAAWIEGSDHPEYAESLCIAMEYCENGDLLQLIRKQRQNNQFFENDAVMVLAVQMLSALAYIHFHKLLHRDIKPCNLFITKRDERSSLVLGDFGLSRNLEHTAAMAMTRVGTPKYCSPEVVAGEEYTGKTDVWAVGVVLYEIMAGARPFGQVGDKDDKVFERILHEDPIPRLKAISEGRYSNSLLNVVDACLKKNERDRPTAYQLLTSFSKTITAFVTKHNVPLPPVRSGSPLRGLRPPTPTECMPYGGGKSRPASPVPPPPAIQQGKPPHTATLAEQFIASFPAGGPLANTVPPGELQQLLHHDEELLMIVKLMCLSRKCEPRTVRERGIRAVIEALRPDVDTEAVLLLLAASG